MEFFEDFKKTNVTSASTTSNSDDNVKVGEGGLLLITGANDWDAVYSSITTGWDTFHYVSGLPSTVVSTYSSASAMHLFILLSDGSLWAMGKNDRGQLGTGDIVSYHNPVPISYKFPDRIVKVSVGRAHSLVLLANGKVFGCGNHSSGQLGLGDSKSLVMKDQLRFLEVPSLENIIDIAAGENYSLVCNQTGRVFAFGHPENGVLGIGTTGGYIKEGKSGQMQYNCVFRPVQITNFVTKDTHNKVVENIPADTIKIRLVAAGKSHSLCVEEWENDNADDVDYNDLKHKNRVFSWGFGGYGRLGHACNNDELIPREITFFAQQITTRQPKPLTSKMVRAIDASSSFSLALTESKTLHFWGKLARAPESTMYPKPIQDLIGLHVNCCSGGSNCVFITADNNEGCIGWGQPISGKYGFEGGGKSSAQPKYIPEVNPLHPTQVSCGYGHVCVIVENTPQNIEKLDTFPKVVAKAMYSGSASASSSDGAATGSKGKKRAAGEDGKEKAATKKKTK